MRLFLDKCVVIWFSCICVWEEPVFPEGPGLTHPISPVRSTSIHRKVLFLQNVTSFFSCSDDCFYCGSPWRVTTWRSHLLLFLYIICLVRDEGLHNACGVIVDRPITFTLVWISHAASSMQVWSCGVHITFNSSLLWFSLMCVLETGKSHFSRDVNYITQRILCRSLTVTVLWLFPFP